MNEIKNNHKDSNDNKGLDSVTLKESEYNELKAAAEKSKDVQDKLLRSQADFENMRKRLEREKQDFLLGALTNLQEDVFLANHITILIRAGSHDKQ